MFFLKFKTLVLSSNRFGKQAIKAFQNTSFSKATVVLFSRQEKRRLPKSTARFPAKKRWYSPPLSSGFLGTPLPLPQSLYGRAYADVTEPKFLGSMVYQICLAMVLHYYDTSKQNKPDGKHF